MDCCCSSDTWWFLATFVVRRGLIVGGERIDAVEEVGIYITRI